MRIKRDITTKFGLFGAFFGLLYFALTFNEFNLSTLFIFFSTILYFSLLGLVFSIIILLFSDVRVDRWHMGVVFGYLFYLVSSVLLYAFYIKEKVSIIKDVIFLGPIPGFILQICLILLGLTLGMYLSNTDLIKIKIR